MTFLSGKFPVQLECSDTTNEPIRLLGGSEEVKRAVEIFNEMLDCCHKILKARNDYLERIRKEIKSLRMLAVMQQILTICSTFEQQAPTNIDIFATEIQSLFLDVRSAGTQNLSIVVN